MSQRAVDIMEALNNASGSAAIEKQNDDPNGGEQTPEEQKKSAKVERAAKK